MTKEMFKAVSTRVVKFRDAIKAAETTGADIGSLLNNMFAGCKTVVELYALRNTLEFSYYHFKNEVYKEMWFKVDHHAGSTLEGKELTCFLSLVMGE